MEGHFSDLDRSLPCLSNFEKDKSLKNTVHLVRIINLQKSFDSNAFACMHVLLIRNLFMRKQYLTAQNVKKVQYRIFET